MSAPIEAPLKELVRQTFNRISAPYARFALQRLRRETAREVELLQPRRDHRVLDVACGPGTLALALAPHVRVIYGLDIAEQMIARAQIFARRQPSENLHFMLADAERIPFPEGCFDLVTCGYSFAHFPDPACTLAEMARVVKPHGRMAILELLAPGNPIQRERMCTLEDLRQGFHTRTFTLVEFRNLFERSGMRLVDCRIRKRARWFRDWARLGSLAQASHAYRQAWQILIESLREDATGLQPRRVGNDIRFYHTTATFILLKNGCRHRRTVASLSI